MYTIILYDDENKVLDMVKPNSTPVVKDNNITWNNGSLNGINSNFIVVEGDLEFDLDMDVTEWIPKDVKKGLKGEQEQIKEQLVFTQSMVNGIVFDPTNAQQNEQIIQTQAMLNQLLFGGMLK